MDALHACLVGYAEAHCVGVVQGPCCFFQVDSVIERERVHGGLIESSLELYLPSIARGWSGLGVRIQLRLFGVGVGLQPTDPCCACTSVGRVVCVGLIVSAFACRTGPVLPGASSRLSPAGVRLLEASYVVVWRCLLSPPRDV